MLLLLLDFSQIGASEHAAEIHWVHLKEGTEDELLVVGVLFDTSEYGSNVEVSAYPATEDVVRSPTRLFFLLFCFERLLRATDEAI